MIEFPTRSWHTEFAPPDLETVRNAIPAAINESQTRSTRAHLAYDDPDGDQHVYGAGMARGVQKELARMLSGLPSFRRATIDGTPRELLFIGRILLFPIRVGKKMPRNIRRVRIPYLPDGRRSVFAKAGMHKYDEPGLFDADPTEPRSAKVEDVINYIAGIERDSLIVPYYSSTPDGVGSIYWAPARLAGRNYLEFSDPESLTYVSRPSVTRAIKVPSRTAASTFADGTRPRTLTKLRGPRTEPTSG